ncbi:DUF4097 family beta strand repeat-containing protein [Nonomuraea muscovyensis]|uniref:DUF4097 domain-containing protein n=1 Tax=Nonomuraea muscovyensis TaxID=1124761 RepID=A0A7X0BZV4_9ACTN|nr:DUF4097 family beta strand repeat-containing protein [Nonomuraea muscovyensis]MBB6344561.1 hypothetical protein [Nonomuraea muscovyensis]MDF2705392.1 hypothetical protein [Nonomuraea muscovyensis]
MKRIAIAGGLLASAALLTGCGLQGLAGPTNQDTATYDVTDKVTALRVEPGSGDAVISEYDGRAVHVTETLGWRGTKPEAEHVVEGDTLRLSYTCHDGPSCHVNYRIQVPKGLTVDVESGSGDVTLRSLSGTVKLSMGSGDVDGNGLTGKRLTADLGSGSMELKYAAAPDDARLETGSGDIMLRVPDGSYAVTTDMGSGDESISVKRDNASPHKMTIKAGSGDVSVLPG